MIGILILGLSTILAGALPWWPYSATGRLRHQKPWDWLMDQNRLTGHVDSELEVDPAAALVEKLAAAKAARHVDTDTDAGRERLVA